MIPLKSGPYLYAACTAITFVIFLSWRSIQEADSTRSKWSIPNISSSSVAPKIGTNWVSAGWGQSRKVDLDTTSEIGRASNATLGVSATSLSTVSVLCSALSNVHAISSRRSSFWD